MIDHNSLISVLITGNENLYQSSLPFRTAVQSFAASVPMTVDAMAKEARSLDARVAAVTKLVTDAPEAVVIHLEAGGHVWLEEAGELKEAEPHALHSAGHSPKRR